MAHFISILFHCVLQKDKRGDDFFLLFNLPYLTSILHSKSCSTFLNVGLLLKLTDVGVTCVGSGVRC